MENKKSVTAVEWLENELSRIGLTHEVIGDKIKQAKAMEKEQIIDAHFEGQANQNEGYPIQISKQYYNETYGGGK